MFVLLKRFHVEAGVMMLALVCVGAAFTVPATTARPFTVGAHASPASAAATIAMKLDVSPSVAKQFENNVQDAILVEKVVRAAESELKSNANAQESLGSMQRVEICVGAGVQPGGDVKVRFFGIFSTTGRSTYSCNVSATGRVSDGQVTITKLSCAKDEGWGRTFDII